MKLRVTIFDDDELIRQLLTKFCARRGHEVFTFADPGLCPLHLAPRCHCPHASACTDVIISDLNMPNVQGLDFVEEILKKGCKCPHVALMSGLWSEEQVARAKRLGCKLFTKPFELSELESWLAETETAVDPGRQLADWPGQTSKQ